MQTIRLIIGLILIIIGGLALFGFKMIEGYFLFISQDGSIVPHSLLQLRICLITLAVVGLLLIFRAFAIRLFSSPNDYIMHLTRSEFLKLFFLIALVLRVLTVLLLDFHLWIDYQTYDELGWWWASNGAFNIDGIPTAYRPPGYPFFLSRLYLIFGHHPQLAVIANIIFSLGIVLLCYLIVRRIWDEQIARWSMIILIFFPSQLLFVNLLATEPLFTVIFLFSIDLILYAIDGLKFKWHLLFIGGLLLGLAALTRPLVLVYPLILIIFLYLKNRNIRETIRSSLIIIFGFIIVVTPYMMRNYYLKGSFTISTNSGINFLIGNQPGSGMGWNQPVTDEFAIGDPTQEVYVDSVGWFRGWQYIKSNPTAFFKRGLLKVMYFYAVDMEGLGYELVEAADEDRLDIYLLLAFITESYYIMILLFGFMGLIIYSRNKVLRNPGGFLLWSTILFWTIIHFVFFADGRFHFPIMPMISVFAAIYLVQKVREIS
jgi:4-amino-4-deoxy-L-arabinose transferase-like glycosyltransferase